MWMLPCATIFSVGVASTPLNSARSAWKVAKAHGKRDFPFKFGAKRLKEDKKTWR
jgi:hypothetical protein